MNCFWYRTVQWPVGQGFFHAGRLEIGGTSVTYVYDCGTSSKQSNFERELKNLSSCPILNFRSKIDILYLSHFDLDHISGLESLLKRFRPDRIVIPLLSPEEQLFQLTASLHGGAEPTGVIANVILNPVAALTNLAGGGGVIITQVRPWDGSSNEVQGDGNLYPTEGVCNAIEARRVVPGFDARPAWVFQPYVLAEVSAHRHAFRKELLRLLPDATLPASTLAANHAPILIQAYKYALKSVKGSRQDLNFTSLSLYSGPAEPSPGFGKSCSLNNNDRRHWCDRPAWLGAGDAPLKAKTRAEEFVNFYSKYLDAVGIFAVPHHGSRRSWNSVLSRRVPLSHFMASTGKPSRYGHPHKAVVDDVKCGGGTFHRVTQDPSTRSVTDTYGVV